MIVTKYYCLALKAFSLMKMSNMIEGCLWSIPTPSSVWELSFYNKILLPNLEGLFVNEDVKYDRGLPVWSRSGHYVVVSVRN